MYTQTVQIAVRKKNNAIAQVGKGFIYQPKTNFSGGSVKWYKDKLKQSKKQSESGVWFLWGSSPHTPVTN